MLSQDVELKQSKESKARDVRELLLICLEEMDVDDIRRALKEMLARYNGRNQKVYSTLVAFKRELSELTGTVEVI